MCIIVYVEARIMLTLGVLARGELTGHHERRYNVPRRSLRVGNDSALWRLDQRGCILLGGSFLRRGRGQPRLPSHHLDERSVNEVVARSSVKADRCAQVCGLSNASSIP